MVVLKTDLFSHTSLISLIQLEKFYDCQTVFKVTSDAIQTWV